MKTSSGKGSSLHRSQCTGVLPVQDVPDASDRIYLFLECAVLDNCVDADYIQRLPEKFLSSLSSSVLEANPQLETYLQKYAKNKIEH